MELTLVLPQKHNLGDLMADEEKGFSNLFNKQKQNHYPRKTRFQIM